MIDLCLFLSPSIQNRRQFVCNGTVRNGLIGLSDFAHFDPGNDFYDRLTKLHLRQIKTRRLPAIYQRRVAERKVIKYDCSGLLTGLFRVLFSLISPIHE